MKELQKIETFRRDLALAETFEEIQLIREAAAAYAEFVRRMGIAKEKQDEIGLFIVDCDAKLADWLDENFPHGSNQYTGGGFSGATSTMPVEKTKSHRTKKLRNIKNNEPEVFNLIVDEIKASDNTIISSNAILEHYNRKKAEEKKEEFKQNIEKQIEEIESGKLPELEGLFDVLSVDPPWPYGREYDPQGSRVANPYPEMSIEDIKAIELPTQDNAVLWLWTTHKFLPDAFEIMKEWGFDYKATLVWNKENIGMGSWVRMQCEFCLLGIKGKPFFENTTERDIITEARREHSRKPDAFYSLVDKVCLGRKLEYFSREKRDGWYVFGNDTDKF